MEQFRTGGRSHRGGDERRADTFQSGRETAAVTLRNYDHLVGYDLTLRLEASEGEEAFEKRYYLPPGEVTHSPDPVSPGEYEATVVCDGDRQATGHCRVGPRPEHTVVVEVGNGAVALTEGV